MSLNVTVTDQAGHYLTDLDQRDFQVFEDGAQQQLTFFNRSNLPIALSILLDTSASMESKLDTAQEAAIGFVKRLRPQDLAQVIDFDSRVQVIQSFTNNVAISRRAIRRTDRRRLDLAAQRDLHRAEGAEATQAPRHGRDPATGDRRALRRRGHVQPRQLRRGAGSRQAVRDGDLRDRPALARRARTRASAMRSSSCAS